MCLGVFIASDSKLRLIDWTVDRPGFNVSGLRPSEESVRKWLKRPNVYALGSHTHCGCGFQQNEDNAPADVAASRQALSDYVAEALQHSPVDLYVCWNGEAGAELVREVTTSAKALVVEESWLEEGALTHVVST
jgi:hypothetical protein